MTFFDTSLPRYSFRPKPSLPLLAYYVSRRPPPIFVNPLSYFFINMMPQAWIAAGVPCCPLPGTRSPSSTMAPEGPLPSPPLTVVGRAAPAKLPVRQARWHLRTSALVYGA
ncbi:hypothetical protein LY78DRAFT_428430 [Colletotrichum sublineola]|nr:hypothetical protein LY78DRAFT_428430 [Colletotrichum sublineola]